MTIATENIQPERKKAPNSPSRPRISKEPDARRQEIIETALALLKEKGYANMTVQDITERMNVSPGLCYRYFKSKTAILTAVSKFYALQMLAHLEAPMPKELPALEKLALSLQRMYDFTKMHYEFEARYNEGPEFRAIYLDTVASRWAALLLPILTQGVKEGRFNCQIKALPATAKFLTFGLIHTFHDNTAANNHQSYLDDFLKFSQVMFAEVLGFPVKMLQ